MYYNVRRTVFPDGTMKYMFSERMRQKDYTLEEKPKRTGETVERKEADNLTRAKSEVYDLGRSNQFEWFVTLTLSPEYVNRFDYNECAECVKAFTHRLARHGGCSWIIVPERHRNGAYHFHGLVNGLYNLQEARHPKTGKLLFDEHGRQIYNIGNYEWGFTSATRIGDPKKTVTYLTEYFTKDMGIPKGRKRYWASRNLQRPEEECLIMSSYEYGEIFNAARYQKVIESEWGMFILCEVDGGGDESGECFRSTK